MSLHIASVSAALIITALGLSLLTNAAHMPEQMSSMRSVPSLNLSGASWQVRFEAALNACCRPWEAIRCVINEGPLTGAKRTRRTGTLPVATGGLGCSNELWGFEGRTAASRPIRTAVNELADQGREGAADQPQQGGSPPIGAGNGGPEALHRSSSSRLALIPTSNPGRRRHALGFISFSNAKLAVALDLKFPLGRQPELDLEAVGTMVALSKIVGALPDLLERDLRWRFHGLCSFLRRAKASIKARPPAARQPRRFNPRDDPLRTAADLATANLARELP